MVYRDGIYTINTNSGRHMGWDLAQEGLHLLSSRGAAVSPILAAIRLFSDVEVRAAAFRPVLAASTGSIIERATRPHSISSRQICVVLWSKAAQRRRILTELELRRQECSGTSCTDQQHAEEKPDQKLHRPLGLARVYHHLPLCLLVDSQHAFEVRSRLLRHFEILCPPCATTLRF